MNTGRPSSAPIRSPTRLRRRARALQVLRPQRHDRHHVGGADPRVRAFVGAQVDPLDGDRDPCQQRVGQLRLRADEREDRAVVVGVGVHVEQARVRAERDADRVDRRRVAALAEVRNRLERQHARTLGGVKEYYDRPGARVRRLVARARSLRGARPARLGGRSSSSSPPRSPRSRRRARSTSPAAPGS